MSLTGELWETTSFSFLFLFSFLRSPFSHFSLFPSMSMECPFCAFQTTTAWLLRRHVQDVHIGEPARQWKCSMPGCENAPSTVMHPGPIADHHCAHYRFRDSVRDYTIPEDEASVPSFEPSVVFEGQADRDLAIHDEAAVQFDDWLLDVSAPVPKYLIPCS